MKSKAAFSDVFNGRGKLAVLWFGKLFAASQSRLADGYFSFR